MGLHLLLFIIFAAFFSEICADDKLKTSYSSEFVYSYKYESKTVVGDVIATDVKTTINLQVVSENQDVQEIKMTFLPLSVVYHSFKSTQTMQQQMQNWFSVLRDHSGRINMVKSFNKESMSVLAVKKSIARLFSLENETFVEDDILENGTQILTQKFTEFENGYKRICFKEVAFSSNGLLQLVNFKEDAVVEKFINRLQSDTNITLINVLPKLENSLEYADNVTLSYIGQYESIVPQFDISTDCVSNISCYQNLMQQLPQLSESDLKTLVRLVMKSKNSLEIINFIDILVSSGVDNVAKLLNEFVLSDQSHTDSVLQRALLHLGITFKNFTDDMIDVVMNLTSNMKLQKGTRSKAFLVLGGIAMKATDQQSKLIVQFLYHNLKKTSNSQEKALLIDSLGNVGSPLSLQYLHEFMKSSEAMNVQNAAIRAMRHHKDPKTALLLQHLIETTYSPSIQNAAVALYKTHPYAKKDFLKTFDARFRDRVKRSRRNTDDNEILDMHSNSYNTTMPSINWNTRFGDNNISVNLERVVHNDFKIYTDPFSSKYEFSMRDEAKFAVDLQLSSGHEHHKFLETHVCLEGKATYNTNIMKFTTFDIRDEFIRYSAVVQTLLDDFEAAYDFIISSQHIFSSFNSDYSSSLDNTQSNFLLSFQTIAQAYMDLTLINEETVFKSDIFDVLLNINSTLTDIYGAFVSKRETITNAVNEALPNKLQSFISAFSVNGQPFTKSSIYLPYLQYAPRKALANIYEIYWISMNALTTLEAGIENVKKFSSKFGSNKVWTNPSLSLWSTEGILDDIYDNIQLHTKSVADTTNLLKLSGVITDHLKPALLILLTAPDSLHNTTNRVSNALNDMVTAFDKLTMVYESAKSTIDMIFGQQVYPGFPSLLKPCSVNYGCGLYPSTGGGLYRNGIDVIGSQAVVSPFAGYISLLDLNSLNTYHYNETNAVVLNPTEFSLQGYYFVISNIAITSGFSANNVFVRAGEMIGSALLMNGVPTVHFEMYKIIGNDHFNNDPSYLLPKLQEPTVTTEWNCNEVVTMVQGVVVQTIPVTTKPTQQVLIGDPLVTIQVPDHEFPQTYDVLLEESQETSSQNDVQFFHSSTTLMVGPLPVSLSFTSMGHYKTNISFQAHYLTKQLTMNVTPQVWSEVNGNVKIGNAVYAIVEINGTLLDCTLPLSIEQDFNHWPLSAKSYMNLTIKPNTVSLHSTLVDNAETIDNQRHWYFSMTLVNRTEFSYEGSYSDPTLPLFSSPSYYNGGTCYVQQLAGRKYNNPAFELEFNVDDKESSVDIFYTVGTFDFGSDVIPKTKIQGGRIVVPHFLLPARKLYFTISATNANLNISVATCQLPIYDRSPPLAHVIPISTTTSHPNKFIVLLSLFDESQLADVQEIALGSVAGEEGNDILDWQEFNSTLISITPTESGLGLYSFPMNGRFIDHILSVFTDVITAEACGNLCSMNKYCLSFDHSNTLKRCILHNNIEGPATDNRFPNNFATSKLHSSHDFNYYEKLGVGNSSIFTFTNLTLEHRRNFTVNLRLKNILGYKNIISSTSILVDLTPPLPGFIQNAVNEVLISGDCGFNIKQTCIGDTTSINNHWIITDGLGSTTVFNGLTPLYDSFYTSINNFLAANWDGFHDKESGISSYTWCISSNSSYTCDILSQSDPHNGEPDSNFWTNSGLAKLPNLEDGSYYFSVDAINGVGYGGSLVTTVHHSTPYIIDTTPPIILYLQIEAYDNIENMLNITFNISDNESGIARASIAIGSTIDGTEIFPWTTLTEESSAIVNVTIPDGVNGWVKLEAINNVNLKTTYVAKPAVVTDRSPPIIEFIKDGEDSTVDVDYQSSTTSVCLTWGEITDPHSEIILYQWGVGLSPENNTDDLLFFRNLTDIEINDHSACKNITLVHNKTYYSTLSVTNGAEIPLVTTKISDGVIVDSTSPLPGTVLDGKGMDLQYSTSLTHAAFTWQNFSDPESSIDYYKILVYQKLQDGFSSALVHTETVYSNFYSSDHFSFSNGDFIFATIEAFNLAASSVNSSSDGYTIDLTPPLINYLIDGTDASSDLTYQSSTTMLSASWSAYDLESHIEKISIAIFELSEGRKIRIHPNPEFEDILYMELNVSYNNYTVIGLELAHGSNYIFNVLLVNGAGLQTSYETNGVFIDSIPPQISFVSVLGELLNSNFLLVKSSTMVHAEWFGFDEGSDISSYLVAILTENDDFVTDYNNFGTSNNGIITGLNLTIGNVINGPFYKVRVIAVDLANQQSPFFDSALFFVSNEDNTGVVYDGFNPFVETQYTDELSSLSASFAGFTHKFCMEISSYQWAVRTQSMLESILPFTREGIVLLNNSFGYSQTFISNLQNYISSQLFITVRATTVCNDTLEFTSTGFTIDPLPLSVIILGTGFQSVESRFDNATQPHNMYQSIESFSAAWVITKFGQELKNEPVKILIGTYPKGNDIVNEMNIKDNFIRSKIEGKEGIPNYVTVIATNNVGLQSFSVSDPVVLDTSLPSVGMIACSLLLYSTNSRLLLLNPNFQIQFSCLLIEVNDLQSGINQFTVSITLQNGLQISSQKVQDQLAFLSPVVDVNNHTSYYITVHVENGAGLINILTSDLISIDLTPPVSSGQLLVSANHASGYFLTSLTHGDPVCLWWNKEFSLYFQPFIENESDIIEHQLGIGTIPGGDDIYHYETIKPLKSSESYYFVINNLSYDLATSRQPLYFTIRAINSAFLHTDLTSQKYYIKSSSNTKVSKVYDGIDLHTDIDFQNYTTYISGHLHYGINCPLKTIEWGVEGVDGVIVKNFNKLLLTDSTSLNEHFSFSSDQVRLHNQETYRLVVRGIDYADEVFIFRSNGTSVTTYGLEPGNIFDGRLSDENLEFQDSTMSLTFHLSGFGDGTIEQTILFYEAAVGTNPQYPNTRSDIIPFVNIGLNSTVTFTNLSLISQEQTYFVTIRAHALSGAISEVTSNGITPGYNDIIRPGEIAQTMYQFNTSILSVQWTAFQSDVPMLYYEWAITDYALNTLQLTTFCSDLNNDYSADLIHGFTNVELNTFVLATGLQLEHNQTYFVLVRTVDEAGKCKTVISTSPTKVDTTPPFGKSTVIGPSESHVDINQYIAYLQLGNDLVLIWEDFTDLESPIESYEVALFELITCSSDAFVTGDAIVNYTNVGLQTSFTFEHLNLQSNMSYIAKIKATNKAGLDQFVQSQPVMLDSYKLISGQVKDGNDWTNDLVFQSNTNELSGVFSMSFKQPYYNNIPSENPCPINLFLQLNKTYSEWSNKPPAITEGLVTSSIRYEANQINVEMDGTKIVARFDPIEQQVVSGIYTYSNIPSINDQNVVSISIQGTQGNIELAEQTITSLLFLESSVSDLLVENDNESIFNSAFTGLGLQLHHSFSDESGYHQQKVILWSKSIPTFPQVRSISRDVSIDISQPHQYSFHFTNEQLGLTYQRKVELYIDDILYATLHGIAKFSNETKLILHVFNRKGFTPYCDQFCADNPPEVFSKFTNLTLPSPSGGVCDNGQPFYSWGSPIVDFQVAVGTQPGLNDVRDYESIYTPCLPCQSTPCFQYGCISLCPTDSDPFVVNFTLLFNQSTFVNDSGSSSGETSYMLSEPLIPGTYYLTVSATSASGQVSTSSSNGAFIDVTSPVLSLPIRHYDVDFSLTQSTRYQGNNHTISASWTFDDPESGIIEYYWAIGTTRYGEEIQNFTFLGLNNHAKNNQLEGVLVHNVTYYVSVIAKNGAGLFQKSTSNGITYVFIELNKTMLDLSVKVHYIDIFYNVTLNGQFQRILWTDSDNSAAIEWSGVSNDISKIYWYIGSEPEQTDILPVTDISYSTEYQASIDNGVLFIDNVAFSNLSQLNNDDWYFEPGRLLYHTIEFCTLAHNCKAIDPRPAIVVRPQDGQKESMEGEDITVTITQTNIITENIPTLDKNYTLTLTTYGGLQKGTRLFTGFLQQKDVSRNFQVNLPYISNPNSTMDQTSRVIARRFIAIGGPSFYVSFLGQDSLNGQLNINVTFDSSIDWSNGQPVLAYWDIDASWWREVTSTCGSTLHADFLTNTISVDVCSTFFPDSSNIDRPLSLSRRRREIDGSGNETEFLDRPTQFIVMKLGNFSLNTAPKLSLPLVLELEEDISLFTYTIPYTDNEADQVFFYLQSIPKLGNAMIDNVTGVLSYTPCQNCTGIENIYIYIIEKGMEFGPALYDFNILQLIINNHDDLQDIFLYESISSEDNAISSNDNITVFVDANITESVVIARVGVYDVDGYHDDLELFVTNGVNGSSGYMIWLDAVATAESLPVNWEQSPIRNYTGYIAFVGANITYLPNSDFVGTEHLRVYSQQTDQSFSRSLDIIIEVLPSWCVNGGKCNGTQSDPTCTDTYSRKNNPDTYSCACPPNFSGSYCEINLTTPISTYSACANNIPQVVCNGDPCDGASCPNYPDAVCIPDYCGHCQAVWYQGDRKVTCSINDPSVCMKPLSPDVAQFCTEDCDCPKDPFQCPQDSVFIENRNSPCCVQYSCVCPNISCPLFINCGHGVQPIPNYNGGFYPGRCCPEYSFHDIDECGKTETNTCSDICQNESPFFTCDCPTGKTLALDGRTCGVCNYRGHQYLYGDSVKIGCNWCICQEDALSGERWHCTAKPCNAGCYYNGMYYQEGWQIAITSNNCTCQHTTFSAEWNCEFTVLNTDV